MKYSEDFKFESALDVVNFFHYLIFERGIMVHPDYPLEARLKGENVVSNADAKLFSGLMDAAFEFCDGNGIDIYHLGYDVLFDFVTGKKGKF